MGSPVKDPETLASHPHSAPESSAAKAVILSELEKILDSPPFRGSSRRKEFLSYVVHHSLEGHHELLKERIIGAEVFHREADYATGDDPVVRVQAGEVRRRLETYYTAPPDLPVRIEIPLGSYCPAFHWNPAPASGDSHAAHNPAVATPPRQPDPPDAPELHEVAQPVRHQKWGVDSRRRRAGPHHRGYRRGAWPARAQASCVIPRCVLVAGLSVLAACHHLSGKTRSLPALRRNLRALCPPSSGHVPDRGRARQRSPAPQSLERITWGDMQIYPGYGVASGDTFAAVKFLFLVRMGKPSQVRSATAILSKISEPRLRSFSEPSTTAGRCR